MHDKDERKLFRVTNAQHEVFYVVCTTETEAAKAAAALWIKWKYLGDGTALKIELVAEAKQHRAKGANWLEVV